MRKLIITATMLALGVLFYACNKKDSKAPQNPSEQPVTSNNQTNETMKEAVTPEFYYINGVEVPLSQFNKNRELLTGQEMVTVVQSNAILNHFFTDMSKLQTWANTIPNGNKLVEHLTRFDNLSAKAQRDGEIQYFEQNGQLSPQFNDYLLNGNFNYQYTPNGRSSLTLGQFMKGYSSFGPSLPVFTFPHVGSSFDNQISYHQAIGIGWVSIFDRSFWRSRLKTFWFVAYTSRTYWGWGYDNKTTSVSLSF
jgi:hypothetical protein